MTPAAREAFDLGKTLAAVHFGLSGALLGWLVIGTGRGSTVARDLGWGILEMMHLPLAAAHEWGLFSAVPWWGWLPLSAVLVGVSSFGNGLLTAGLFVWVRRSISEGVGTDR